MPVKIDNARAKMTMRAAVQRDGASGTDGFGQPNAASWASHLSSLACWVWTPSEREVVDGAKTATIGSHKMIVPRGTDITEDDRITAITDRRASTIIGNTMRILSVVDRGNHLALDIEELR